MDMEDVGTKCRICGNRKGHEIYKCKDRRLNLSGGGIFRYLFCAHCGTLSLVDVPEDMGKYYGSSYYSFHIRKSNKKMPAIVRIIAKFFTVDFGLPTFIRMILRGKMGTILLLYKTQVAYEAKICDVGGGNGAWVARLTDWGFKDVKCVDQFVPETPFQNISFEYSDFLKMDEKIKYDLITFHHSFEHMSAPDAVLKKVKRVMNENGMCIIRIPLCDSETWKAYRENWFQIDPPRHYYLFTKKSMKLLCERNGLRVAKIVYDSGCEQYSRSELFRDSDISFNDAMKAGQKYERRYFLRALFANIKEYGDQAAFYIKHAN